MRTATAVTAALFALASAAPAFATGFDGTRPFTCHPVDIVSCAAGTSCEKETPDSVNLPAAISFDVGANKITGKRPDGEALETSIDNVRHVADDLALQGVQGSVVWSVTVGKQSGAMALAAMGGGVGYIAFGSCSLP